MPTTVFVKKNGKPDMRYARNRQLFLKDPTKNLDASADIRLSVNKDKIATKKEVEKTVHPNVDEEYFVV